MRSLCIPNSTLVHLSSKLSYVETHDFLSIKWGFLSPQFDLNSYFSVYTFFFFHKGDLNCRHLWCLPVSLEFNFWVWCSRCSVCWWGFFFWFFFLGVKWGFIGVSKLSLLLNFYRLAVCNRNCHTFLDQS